MAADDLKKWAKAKTPEKLQKMRAKADETLAEARAYAAKQKSKKAAEAFADAARQYADLGDPLMADRATSLGESHARDAARKPFLKEQIKKMDPELSASMRRSTK